MGKFNGVPRIGLKDNDTKKVIAVYPKMRPEGTDAEIEQSVKDWYYTTSCAAEDILLNAYVDKLSKDEIRDFENNQLK